MSLRSHSRAACVLPPHLSPLGRSPSAPSLRRSIFARSLFCSTHFFFFCHVSMIFFFNISAGSERGYEAKALLSVPSQRLLAGKGFASLPRNLQHFTPTAKRPLQPSAWLGCSAPAAQNKFPRAHVLLCALCLINLYHGDGNETDRGLGCLWCAETRRV